MAQWIESKGKEILRISFLPNDRINEIKDCYDKKVIEETKLKNTEQLLCVVGAVNFERTQELLKTKSKIKMRIGLINDALEVLNKQMHRS